MLASLGRVLAIAVSLAAFSACAGQNAPDQGGETPDSMATASPQSSAPGNQALGDGTAALQDGRHPVRFTQVNVPGRAVTFDLLQFLTGAAAKAEWLKEHPEEPDGPPNDYLIVNNNPLLRTLPVATDVTVKVLNPATSDPTTPLQVPFANLTNYITAGIFWMTVAKGAVVLVEEQFLP